MNPRDKAIEFAQKHSRLSNVKYYLDPIWLKCIDIVIKERDKYWYELRAKEHEEYTQECLKGCKKCESKGV